MAGAFECSCDAGSKSLRRLLLCDNFFFLLHTAENVFQYILLFQKRNVESEKSSSILLFERKKKYDPSSYY